MNCIVCCYWFNVDLNSPPTPQFSLPLTSPLTSPPTKGECIFHTGGGHSYQFVIYAACSSVMFPLNSKSLFSCYQSTSTKQKKGWQLLLPQSIPSNTYRCTGWWWKQDRLSVPAKWSSHVSQGLYRGLQSDVYATDLPVSKEKHYNMKHFSSVSKSTSALVTHNIINFKNSNIKKAKKPAKINTQKWDFMFLIRYAPFFSLLSFFFFLFILRVKFMLWLENFKLLVSRNWTF